MNSTISKGKLATAVALAYLTLGGIGTASAVPILQIDIDGGTYVGGGEESTVTTSPTFDLYALGTPSGNTSAGDLLDQDYYLSVAIIPQIGPAPVPFGSFSVNGTSYDINDMVYGAPPTDGFVGGPPGPPEAGLPSHGIYDTFYLELLVDFIAGDTASTYDVQDEAGSIGGKLGGTGSYYDLFEFDISGMLSGFNLHFDLYNAVVAKGSTGDEGDLDAGLFAPFSHDARTDCCDDTTKVPEPGTLGLLGIALLGLGLTRRRKLLVRL